MRKPFLLLILSMLTLAWQSVRADETDGLTLSPSSATATENFNSMWDAGTASATLDMPAAWRVERQMSAPRTVGSYSAASTATMYSGGVSLASNASNGTYNFGSSSDNTDRAVGGLSTTVSGGTRCVNVMTKLINGGSTDIEQLSISYDIEKYREGDNPEGFAVQMYYSADGENWTSAGENFYTFFEKDAATQGAAVVPISTTAIGDKVLKTIFPASGTLYLAWNISVAAGGSPNKAMGLAIDNVSITATFANPGTTKHYIYAEKAVKWSNLYLYASGASEPFGAMPGSKADGTTVVNGVTYQYFTVNDENSYSLSFNNGGSNAFDGINVTMNRDYYFSVTPEGVSEIADPQSYTGYVDPTRPPFVASGIFLRGEVNSWGADSEWEFSDEGNGVYAMYDKTLSGNFKVADANWSSTCNYGSNGSGILLDTPYSLVLGTNDNISTNGNSYTCQKIILTITTNGATLLLQSDDDPTGLTSVYVIGDNNGWNYMDKSGELKLTDTDDVFEGQVTMAAGADGLCHWRIYQQLGMVGSWGNPGGTDATASATEGTLEKGSTGKMATEAGTYIITFNLATGAYSMEKLGTVIESVKLMPENVVLVPELPEEVKVLSLNNSLIHYNDQDFMFNDIAAAMGKNAKWTKHTLLGKSLNTHWEEGDGLAEDGNPGAKMLVRSEAWSHIILQEQSSLPRTNVESFRASVKKWVDYIREFCPNPNAIVIIPMNWAYSGDWSNFTDFNNKFLENYLSVARELGVTICPVGRAYQDVYDKEGTAGIASWFQDDRHPTDKSTYMAACMEYGLIFGEDPTTITYHPTSVSDADAASMRSYAADALNNFTNYVDHTAGVVRYTLLTLDQYGMEVEAPADMTLTLSGGGTLNGTVFTSDGTKGSFTVTAQNAQFNSTATLIVAEAETEVPTYPYIELNADNLTAAEDFNSMGLEATAAMPEAWRIDRQTAAPRLVGTYQGAEDNTMYAGGTNLPSNAKNGIWNFGKDNDDDRAVGGISTGVANGTRCINVYAHFFNTGRKDLENVKVSYDVEKYRKGSNSAGFTVQLYYSLDGHNWTSAGDKFTTTLSPDAATEGYAEVPGEVIHVEDMLDTKISHGCDFFLAWNITVSSGTAANNAMALAIDNFNIETSLPEIPTAKHYIYVIDETGWDALGLYAWGDGELFGAWPGEAWVDEKVMDDDTYKVFLLDADSGSYNLIFNNWNNGSQLPDYNITANRDYYFRITSSAVEELTLTGISEITTHNTHNNNNIYSMSGQLIANAAQSATTLPKGIYIREGRKFVVR